MALCELAAPPFHDSMKMHSSTSAFHQDDLWTTCGGYEAENGLLSSDDELSSMVSMVTSLQGSHHHPEAFTSGLHRNASFDSGSTSHDSCTPSFSTGSPVTVLPPLPYSDCGDGKDQESYTKYTDGLWTGRASDCDQMLASPGGENFSSLLMNELPLRSYDNGVDQVCGSDDYHLDCIVPTSISSHSSYQTSDSSRAHTTVESSFCQELLLEHEYGSGNRNHTGAHAGSSSANRTPKSPRTNAAAAAASLQVDSEVSPTARRRLSWTDNHWPAGSTNPTLSQASLNNFPSTTAAAQRLQLPQQVLSGFNGGSSQPATFHDADYVATCNQYRQTQLQEITNAGGVPTNSLKRPYSAVQSACTKVAPSPAVTEASPFLKFTAINNHQQDAAALSALLYKNNHGSDLIQQLQAGSSCSSGGSAADTTRNSMLLSPPKLRRRHGTATDPQSIAARTRRERFSDRIRLLQSLVPNGERLDTVSMLGHTLEYVRFLQHQVWQLYNGSDDASIPQPDSASREKWKEFMDAQTMS